MKRTHPLLSVVLIGALVAVIFLLLEPKSAEVEVGVITLEVPPRPAVIEVVTVGTPQPEEVTMGPLQEVTELPIMVIRGNGGGTNRGHSNNASSVEATNTPTSGRQ